MNTIKHSEEWDPLPEAIKMAAGIAGLVVVVLLVARQRAPWYFGFWDRWIVPKLTEDMDFLADWRAQAIAVFPVVFMVTVVPAYQIIWKTRIGLMRRHQERAAAMMREMNRKNTLVRTSPYRQDSRTTGDAVKRFGKDRHP